ncbi:MAG: PDZ domain-containing protein [Bacteroidota bacterium]
MKKLLFALQLVFASLTCFSQTEINSESRVTIIKIDTTDNGEIDTLIFNFDSNSMDIQKWQEMLKDLDVDLSMNFNDSLFDMDFNFNDNMGMPNFDFFDNNSFPYGSPNQQSIDKSAKIGITHSQSFRGEGVMIETVTPTSLAAALGLQTGDILIELNDSKIKSFSDLKSILANYEVGNEARITFLRNGKKKKVVGFFIPLSNVNVQKDIRIRKP